MNGVSVIVCCYNSAKRIEETLRFLCSQQVAVEVPWEIIVVNNASCDNTAEVVSGFTHENLEKVRLTLVHEPEPGLASARRKGVETAAFEILVFCDDDNHFDAYYIQRAFMLMSCDPSIGIAGGWVKPKLPFYPGRWIEANYGALAIAKEAASPGFVDWVFGAGMIFRKKIFAEFKAKGISLMLSGRLGAKQTSGDDAEMCHLARFLGYRIYYSPELIVHHNISSHRLRRSDFIKANYKNVYHVVYFFILGTLMRQGNAQAKNIYRTFFRTRFYNAFYFFPRIFFGKHNFYSFMMFFQSLQLLVWLSLRRKQFDHTFEQIKINLANGTERK